MHNATIPLKPFKAAIFDMDGTMVDNMPHQKKAWQTVLARHGISFTEEDFKQKIAGRKNDQIVALAFGGTLSQKDAQAFLEEKEAVYRELYRPYIREIPGLSSIVKELRKRGIKTAIATSAPAPNRAFILEALHLTKAFDVIVGDENIVHGKPHPEIYQTTARELRVAPAACLVFEDSPNGVTAGKHAGMTVAGILSGYTAEELPGADYVARDFRHIILQ
jgi:HAD superfamily hydrolase (TIGR01509 family)